MLGLDGQTMKDVARIFSRDVTGSLRLFVGYYISITKYMFIFYVFLICNKFLTMIVKRVTAARLFRFRDYD